MLLWCRNFIASHSGSVLLGRTSTSEGRLRRPPETAITMFIAIASANDDVGDDGGGVDGAVDDAHDDHWH